MGFWGDFVVARSDRPLGELAPFAARPRCDQGDAGYLTLCSAGQGEWQVAQSCHFLAGGDYDWWLSELSAVTGSPVMIATVADSALCQVRGIAPSGAAWEAFLDPESAAASGALDYLADEDEDEDDGEGGGDAGGDVVRRLLDAVPGTADQIAGWAAEAGLRADAAVLRDCLVKEADAFVEDVFFELIEACGLPCGD